MTFDMNQGTGVFSLTKEDYENTRSTTRDSRVELSMVILTYEFLSAIKVRGVYIIMWPPMNLSIQSEFGRIIRNHNYGTRGNFAALSIFNWYSPRNFASLWIFYMPLKIMQFRL